jgi:hypothetical protein
MTTYTYHSSSYLFYEWYEKKQENIHKLPISMFRNKTLIFRDVKRNTGTIQGPTP